MQSPSNILVARSFSALKHSAGLLQLFEAGHGLLIIWLQSCVVCSCMLDDLQHKQCICGWNPACIIAHPFLRLLLDAQNATHEAFKVDIRLLLCTKYALETSACQCPSAVSPKLAQLRSSVVKLRVLLAG
jgi:hypothetical protein